MFDFHYYFAIEFLVREEDGAKKGRVGAVGSQGGAPRHGRAVAPWLDEGDIASLTEIAHRSTGGMRRETKGRHVPCGTARRGHLRSADRRGSFHPWQGRQDLQDCTSLFPWRSKRLGETPEGTESHHP